MENDFSPISILQKVIRFWWILVMMMIIGGGVGLIISRLHTPVYESKAVITSMVDYAFISKLDDWEEDQIFQAIGDEIHSSRVMDKVISVALEEGIQLSAGEINKSLTQDRQDTRWMLRVRANSAQVAQRINAIWAQAAMEALTELKRNSITSLATQKYLDSLVSCIEQSVVLDPSSSLCSTQNNDLLKAEIAKIGNDPDLQVVWNSLALSHTSFELTTDPTLPDSAVLFRQNINALVGMLIGLLAGLWIIAADIPLKWLKKGSS